MKDNSSMVPPKEPQNEEGMTNLFGSLSTLTRCILVGPILAIIFGVSILLHKLSVHFATGNDFVEISISIAVWSGIFCTSSILAIHEIVPRFKFNISIIMSGLLFAFGFVSIILLIISEGKEAFTEHYRGMLQLMGICTIAVLMIFAIFKHKRVEKNKYIIAFIGSSIIFVVSCFVAIRWNDMNVNFSDDVFLKYTTSFAGEGLAEQFYDLNTVFYSDGTVELYCDNFVVQPSEEPTVQIIGHLSEEEVVRLKNAIINNRILSLDNYIENHSCDGSFYYFTVYTEEGEFRTGGLNVTEKRFVALENVIDDMFSK